eukprot:706125-Pyramimonas_sp.AAC.1
MPTPGHKLWAAKIDSSGIPVLYCSRCGSCCTKTPRHLLGPCGHKKVAQIRDFCRGRLPRPKGTRLGRPWRVLHSPAKWWHDQIDGMRGATI